MAADRPDSPRPSFAEELASAGGRAAARTLRPFTSAGIAIGRETLDQMLESDELERSLMAALESRRFQAAVRSVLASDGGRELMDSVLDSGLLDRVFEQLVASDALQLLVEEVASSPAVAAAISRQGMGFGDRVGEGLRARTRQADEWLERTVGRIIRRRTP